MRQAQTINQRELSFAGLHYCEQRALLVRRDGSLVHIRNKSLEVFRLLSQHYNCVVSRAEIFDIVWGNCIVTDDSLAQCICEIRKLLGARAYKTLKTFPRRGYALIPDHQLQVMQSETLDNFEYIELPRARLTSV